MWLFGKKSAKKSTRLFFATDLPVARSGDLVEPRRARESPADAPAPAGLNPIRRVARELISAKGARFQSIS